MSTKRADTAGRWRWGLPRRTLPPRDDKGYARRVNRSGEVAWHHPGHSYKTGKKDKPASS